jgi:hypothetical protein
VWSIPTPIGVKISYAILPDLLVASASLELLHDALRRTGQHDLKTIANDAVVQGALSEIGDGPFVALTVSDAPFGAHNSIESLREVGPFLFGRENAPPIPEVDIELVRKYVKGRHVMASRLDRQGLYIRIVQRAEPE